MTKLENKLKELPVSPGVYFHKSADGEIIYVGKASILKNRVRQYFQDSRSRDNKTMALVAEIADVDWIETESEVDALFLESEMVKRYLPRYNVLLRDDKSQSYVRIDMKSEWPIVGFTRNPRDDGAEYFGPFYNGFALKKALRYLRRVYPYLMRERKPGQSKLDEDIGLAPKVSLGSEAYKSDLRQLISYIKGNRKALVNELEKNMRDSAKNHRFEDASIYRNRLRAMKELQNRVSFGDKEFLDISSDQALADLAAVLGFTDYPARIEGFDISHISGSDAVSSMVVFKNGASDRASYRKFKVSERNDDPANIYEVIFRRLSERNLSSWGKPDLILIDGGEAQLSAAVRARNARGSSVAIVSIAKRQEELIIQKGSGLIINRQYLESDGDAEILETKDFIKINFMPTKHKRSGHAKNFLADDQVYRFNDIVLLFQRIRDESHRFAISYHTNLSRKRQTKSILDEIEGIGPISKKKLLTKFGSIKGVMNASRADLEVVIGPSLAEKISSELKDKVV